MTNRPNVAVRLRALELFLGHRRRSLLSTLM
jgi:hypothetical protein